MTSIFYCDINEMPDNEIGSNLRILPGFMQNEIRRFRYITDQKSGLAARLMLYQCLASEGRTDLIWHWERDACNKPFIKGWRQFNIAHSGNIVLFSCDSDAIGVDIEKKDTLNYPELLHHFHPCEEAFIRNSPSMHHAFYEIWVKKESFLKAVGTGLLNGLKDFNCIHDSVECDGKRWFFHELRIHTDYTGYLCSLGSERTITKFPVRKFFS